MLNTGYDVYGDGVAEKADVIADTARLSISYIQREGDIGPVFPAFAVPQREPRYRRIRGYAGVAAGALGAGAR